MFRIDRRLVKLSGTKINRQGADDHSEVGAQGEYPDAATSAEAMVNEYLSAAEAEVREKTEEILAGAREDAEKIVLDARDEAAKIILEAREDAEEERKRGFHEGFEEGSTEGKREYDEKTERKISQDDEALKRVLDEIYEERERTYKDMETEVTNLAVEIVRKIINPAEEELENVFLSLIKNALRQMSAEGKIVLRVGSDEYERFFSSGAATIELDSGVTVTASVLRDVSLDEGDLIIDTDDVTVNAGIESQLQYVQLAFERANQYEPE